MLSSAPLGAHQQKAALTTLRYNPAAMRWRLPIALPYTTPSMLPQR